MTNLNFSSNGSLFIPRVLLPSPGGMGVMSANADGDDIFIKLGGGNVILAFDPDGNAILTNSDLKSLLEDFDLEGDWLNVAVCEADATEDEVGNKVLGLFLP